jgi:hypothetical protein
MKRLMILAALLASSATASAEIVTFDGVPSGNSPTPMSTYVQGGVTVTSLDGNFWSFPDEGQLHFRTSAEGTNNSAYDFTYSGGPFELVSLDIVFAEGFWGAYLQGFDENGDEMTNLFVSGLFGTLPIDGFLGIYTLRITAFGDPGDFFSIDNLEISTPVPEPGTWLTMLLGFAVAGTSLRRRRFSAKLKAA